MNKTVSDSPVPRSIPVPGASLITFEDQLNHAADLLDCANAAAYECGDHLNGHPRALAMASTHLIGLAEGVIRQLLDGLQQLPKIGQEVTKP